MLYINISKILAGVLHIQLTNIINNR